MSSFRSRIVKHHRPVELKGHAIAFAQTIGLVAVGNSHGAFQKPNLLVDAGVARAAFERDAAARREMNFDDMHWLVGARWRDVPSDISRAWITPPRLIFAAGDWRIRI